MLRALQQENDQCGAHSRRDSLAAAMKPVAVVFATVQRTLSTGGLLPRSLIVRAALRLFVCVTDAVSSTTVVDGEARHDGC
jgi:ribosomal protein S26